MSESATSLGAAIALLSEQAGNRSLVPFVGAGASTDAGLPQWKDLVAPLAQQLGVQPDCDVLDLAQWYVDARGRKALLDHVRTSVGTKVSPGPVHSALASITAPVTFTTNYDLLLESAVEQSEGTPPDVIIEDAHIALVDEARRTSIVKLHGCLTLPATIVLTRDDYETYADRHRAMVAYLQSLLATRTFLFVGFSLVDPNFRAIYSTIARALGPYKRQAYLVEGVARPEPLVRYWREKGIVTIELDGYDKVPGCLQQISRRIPDAGSGLAAVRTLGRSEPPPLEVEPLFETLTAARAQLSELIRQSRETGFLPTQDDPAVETPDNQTSSSPDQDETGAWIRRKARALLDLASAIDGVIPVDNPADWVSLGDLLYEQGDAAGSIRAYQAALRPSAERLQRGSDMIRRIKGNLGRAYAHEGHHARAEWLLRQCVYVRDDENGPPILGRWGTFRRLDFESLRERPTDAAELAHAITRRVERLRGDGHPLEAFEAVAEVRYLLEPLLRIKHRPQDPDGEDLFGAEIVQLNAQRSWRARGLRSREYNARPFNPKAWAFNVLGKGYRLTAELALDQRRDEVGWYVERADRYLHYASNLDPLLPYPYAHRLHLLNDSRIPPQTRSTLERHLDKDLRRLLEHSGALRVLDDLQSRFADSDLLREVRANASQSRPPASAHV